MRRSEDDHKSGWNVYKENNVHIISLNNMLLEISPTLVTWFATAQQFNNLEILSAIGLYRKRTKKRAPDPSDISVCLLCKFRTQNYIRRHITGKWTTIL
jgi:hypothetical protein